MDDAEQPVDEVLVLRVVSEAHRRRARRLVIAGLLVVVASGGAAIGLTHRLGAEPAAGSAPTARSAVLDPMRAPADPNGATATRAAILAVARARYASAGYPTGHGTTRLEFGRLKVTGEHATLQVNFVCLGLCGHGEELVLAERNGTWQVVRVRQTWLS